MNLPLYVAAEADADAAIVPTTNTAASKVNARSRLMAKFPLPRTNTKLWTNTELSCQRLLRTSVETRNSYGTTPDRSPAPTPLTSRA